MALLVERTEAYSLNPITLSSELEKKLNEKNFLPSTEFYVAKKWLRPQGIHAAAQLKVWLEHQGYLQRTQELTGEGQFRVLNDEACQKFHELKDKIIECIELKDHSISGTPSPAPIVIVAENLPNSSFLIHHILVADSLKPMSAWALKPQFFAQTVGSQPIMQKKLPLSSLPAACLQAVLSIEDTAFLEHFGVSVTGTFRALVKNLTSGRKAQGGSTITQQLVKNYFLTNERTYKRKFQEIILAVLLESQFTKDQILETYLNIIYMAQNGPYQVVGYPAASEYYFQKPIETLKVEECALLAAILNGPGVFNPFRHPVKSLARRDQVLKKMKEQGFLSEEQLQKALVAKLPTIKPLQATETSPYYLDAARAELSELGIHLENKKVLLAVDLESQELAQSSLQNHLNHLEEKNDFTKQLKAEKKKSLEGILLSADSTGRVVAAVGGRSFRKSQFNRIINSQRQIGSLIKPFVYLTAIEKLNLNPLSMIKDEKMEIKINKKIWSPENYDRKFLGEIPLYYALKMSLNASTASIAQQSEIQSIIDTLSKFGVTKSLDPHPSLSLGAIELSPVEVLGPYLALSQMGKKVLPTFVESVWTSSGENVLTYSNQIQTHSGPSNKPESVPIVVGMMKQSLISGTAQRAKSQGLTEFWAGKTGTTSDNRDAWFIGFDRHETTLTWVGYDDNSNSKLTGASGALPIWMNYTAQSKNRWYPKDFAWPDSVEKRIVDQEKLNSLGFTLETESQFELVFDRSFF